MITFTKEQLIASVHARIEFAEMMLAGELEPLKERTWSIELELARIALASLEAEAVSFDELNAAVAEVTGCKPHAWNGHVYKGHQPVPFMNYNSLVRIVDKYRTAPPAPVSAPDERPSLNNGIVGFDEGWNACRAAMLQSFGNSEQLNSPVIQDGWVLVPEEPTHEMLEAGDEQFGTYDVYRRMIAASPKQEVKS